MSTTPCATEAMLASYSDIMSLLARMTAPANRRSRTGRIDQRIAESAMAQLLPNVAPATLPEPCQTPLAAEVNAYQSMPAVGLSKVRQRQHCRCGACKWCLDNARWDRIFNEKFADPTYYTTQRLRYNSSLAGLR